MSSVSQGIFTHTMIYCFVFIIRVFVKVEVNSILICVEDAIFLNYFLDYWSYIMGLQIPTYFKNNITISFYDS